MKNNSATPELAQIAAEVISHLNKVIGSRFRVSAESIRHISARLSEGYTLDDFILVIDFKSAQWLSNETMEQYLRPRTLFGNKFEDYLQNAKRQRIKKSTYDNDSFLKPSWDLLE